MYGHIGCAPIMTLETQRAIDMGVLIRRISSFHNEVGLALGRVGENCWSKELANFVRVSTYKTYPTNGRRSWLIPWSDLT